MATLDFPTHPDAIPFVTLSLVAELLVKIKVMEQQIAALGVQSRLPNNLDSETDADTIVSAVEAGLEEEQQTINEWLEVATNQVSERLKELDASYMQQLAQKLEEQQQKQ